MVAAKLSTLVNLSIRPGSDIALSSYQTRFILLGQDVWIQGWGALLYKRDWYARRKIRIKPLKETNLGVAQSLFDPKGGHATIDNKLNKIKIK